MRKIVAIIFSTVLLFSGVLIPTSYASTNLPLVPTESKSTIKIEKSDASIGDGGVFKVERKEINIPVGQYVKHLGELQFYLERENGSRTYVDYGEIQFSSSNNGIFTILDDFLHGVAIGSATLTATYHGQQLTIKVNVVEQDLILKFENTHNARNARLSSLRYKSNGDYYSHMSVSSNFIHTTGELKISGVDWNQTGPFLAVVALGNHIYKIEINQSDRGSVMTVPYNPSDFTKVTFDIPSAFKIENIGIGLQNNNRVIFSVSSSSYNEYYIAHGEYGFEITGKNDTEIYKGYVDKASLTGTEQQISIPENQFTKMNFNLAFNQPATIETVGYCNFNVVNSCSHMNLEGKDFYLKNGQYNRAVVTVGVGNSKYAFDFKTATIPNDSTQTIDDRLSSELKFANTTFRGGSQVSLYHYEQAQNYLTVKNAAGHKLEAIRDSSYNDYNGKLVFKRGNEVYEVPVTGSLSSPSVVLPNVSGTFEVTYTMGEVDQTPVKVRPDVSGSWTDWTNTKGAVVNNYTWTIRLNDQVDAATVNTNNIFVVDQDGYLVEGVAVRATGTQISVIAPTTGYEMNQTYTLYVRDAVKNTAGKSLNKNTKMQFTTK